MAFDKRRELLFVYSVTDANPNGDPLNQNHPRYDEDTEQVMVSDVRIKRTIRDQMVRNGLEVFVDGEPKTLAARYKELKQSTGRDNGPAILGQCIDTRLFGVTFAQGNEAFSWTGPVQFKWGRSFHAATFEFIQGTAAFATKEDSQQRSFRNEYKVPFALIGVYGIANQYAARTTGASDEDIETLKETLWTGTDNLITRSKNEHKSRMLLVVQYKHGFDSKIGSLDDKIHLLSNTNQAMSKDEHKALRNVREVRMDLTELVEAINARKADIESVQVTSDKDMLYIGKDELTSLGMVEWKTR